MRIIFLVISSSIKENKKFFKEIIIKIINKIIYNDILVFLWNFELRLFFAYYCLESIYLLISDSYYFFGKQTNLNNIDGLVIVIIQKNTLKIVEQTKARIVK